MLKKEKNREKVLYRDKNKLNHVKSSNFYVFTFYIVPWEITGINCPLPQASFKDCANSKLANIIFSVLRQKPKSGN